MANFNPKIREEIPVEKVTKGSFGPWKIILDSSADRIYYLNDQDSDQIRVGDLAPFSGFGDVERYHGYYRVHNQHNSPQIFTPKRMRDWYVKKIVLSCSPVDENADFIALAVTSSGNQLAYCRRGDKNWSSVPLSFVPDANTSTEDAVYIKDGVFVAVSFNESSSPENRVYLTICDFTDPANPPVVRHSISNS